MNRAYSLFEAKTFGTDEQRTISGLATSPVPDRVGDVIDQYGVQVAESVPLLMGHDASKVVGRASFDKPTAAGLSFTAWLPKIAEPGPLKDLVDSAWLQLKTGLLRGVSIGFRVLNDAAERIPGGGTRYKKIEVLELSICSVPMHQLARVEAVKAAADLAIQRAHHANARTNQGSTIMREAAMLTVNSALELDIDVVGGEKSLSQSLSLQLTRISAQHLADELMAFATGRKSVSGDRQVGIALEVLPARSARRQVVKLSSAAPTRAPRPGAAYAGANTDTGTRSAVVYLAKPRRPVVRLR